MGTGDEMKLHNWLKGVTILLYDNNSIQNQLDYHCKQRLYDFINIFYNNMKHMFSTMYVYTNSLLTLVGKKRNT